MSKERLRIWKLGFILLILLLVLSSLAYFTLDIKKAYLITCDVGQGDATLIVHGANEILIDGGPGKKVLDCLSAHMPFWDRTIEAVILTHPDKDHYGGLIDVLKRYKVGIFISNGQKSGSQAYQVLEKLVGGGVANTVVAQKGQEVGDGLISLDIFNTKDTHITSINGTNDVKDTETNDLSLILLFRYCKYRAVITGDAPSAVQELVLQANNQLKGIDYLKLSHHGSKTGLTKTILDEYNPNQVVISVGKNSYGHPAPEVMDILNSKGVKYLRTDQVGDIVTNLDCEEGVRSNKTPLHPIFN